MAEKLSDGAGPGGAKTREEIAYENWRAYRERISKSGTSSAKPSAGTEQVAKLKKALAVAEKASGSKKGRPRKAVVAKLPQSSKEESVVEAIEIKDDEAKATHVLVQSSNLSTSNDAYKNVHAHERTRINTPGSQEVLTMSFDPVPIMTTERIVPLRWDEESFEDKINPPDIRGDNDPELVKAIHDMKEAKKALSNNILKARKLAVKTALDAGKLPNLHLYPVVAELDCSMHNIGGPTTFGMCESCRSCCFVVERRKGYWPGLFKQRQFFLRERRRRTLESFYEWIDEQIRKRPNPNPPRKVPAQPVRDLDLEYADAYQKVLDRSARRLAEFQLHYKQGGIDSIGDVFKDIVKFLVDHKIPEILGAIICSAIVIGIFYFIISREPESAAGKMLQTIAAFNMIPLLAVVVGGSAAVIVGSVVENIVNAINGIQTTGMFSHYTAYQKNSANSTVAHAHAFVSKYGAPRISVEDDEGPHILQVEKDPAPPDPIPETVQKSFLDIVSGVATAMGGEATKVTTKVSEWISVTAKALRDYKTIQEFLQPIVEDIVGAVYENVTGETWIPWSQRFVHQKVLPVLEKLVVFEQMPNLRQNLSEHSHLRNTLMSLDDELKALEKDLMDKKTPPRYMTPVVDARHKIADMVTMLMEIKNAGSTIPKPLFIYLSGEPAGGKTDFSRWLMRNIWENRSRFIPGEVPTTEFSDDLVWVYNPDDEFFSNYHGQFFAVVNDAFLDKTPAVRTKEIKTYVQWVNSEKKPLQKAALPEKEGIFFVSRVVIITTNAGIEVQGAYLESMDALYRRRDVTCHLSAVVDRPPLKISDPGYEDGWDIHSYTPYGKLLGKTNARSVLATCIACLVDNASMSMIKPAAAPLITDAELKAGSRRVAAIRSHVNKTKDATPVTPTNPRHMVWVPKQNTTQGGGSSKNTAKFTRDQYQEFANAWFNAPPEKKIPIWVEFSERYNVQEPWTTDKDTDWLENPIKYSAVLHNYLISLLAEGVASQRHTSPVEKIREFASLVADFPGQVSTRISTWFWDGVWKRAKEALTKWISDNKWSFIFGAIALIGVVGGTISLGFLLAERSKNKKLEAELDNARKPQTDERENEKIAARAEKKLTTDAKAHKAELIKERFPRADEQHTTQGGDNETQIKSVIRRNLFAIGVYSAKEENSGYRAAIGNVLFLYDRYAATALHVCEEIQALVDAKVPLSSSLKQVGVEVEFNPREIKWRRVPHTETAVILFPPSIPPQRKILQHLLTNADVALLIEAHLEDIRIMFRTRSGEDDHQKADSAHLVAADWDHGYIQGKDTTIYWEAPVQTPNGSSGGVWLTTNPKMPRKIIGSHTGRSYLHAHASLYTLEKIHATIALMDRREDDPVTLDVVSSPSLDKVAQCGPVLVNTWSIGEVSPQLAAMLPRSNPITLSPISKFLVDEGHLPDQLPVPARPCVPAQLKDTWTKLGVLAKDDPTIVSDEKVFPLELTHAKRGIAPCDTTGMLLDLASCDWSIPLSADATYTVHKLEDVLYGNAPMDIEGMDMSASPGHPWTKNHETSTRWKLFGIKTIGSKPDRSHWKQEFIDILVWRTACAKARTHVLPTVLNSLKMERRSIHRSLNGELRVFYAGAMDDLILSASFQAELLARMRKAHVTSLNIVGIDPHSPQWAELYRYHHKHPNPMTADAASWDIKQRYKVIHSVAANVLRRLKNENFQSFEPFFTGLGQQDLRFFFWSLLVSKIHANHIELNKVWEMLNTFVSGTYGTSQFNGLLGLKTELTCFAAFLVEKKVDTQFKRVEAFWLDHTSASWYGDDYVCFVSDQLAKLGWNQISRAYYMDALFDIKCTDAHKKPITEPFVKVEDVTVLKRSFVWRDGHCYAPIAKNVIEGALHWVKDASRATSCIISNANNQTIEAVHHGREYYEYLTQLISRAMARAKIVWIPRPFDELDELIRHG